MTARKILKVALVQALYGAGAVMQNDCEAAFWRCIGEALCELSREWENDR